MRSVFGGIAQTVLDFSTSDTVGVGFENYDKLIFNTSSKNEWISPFSKTTWNETMNWYKVFSALSGIFILIAVIILSYKMMLSGNNTAKKNDVKESLGRLLFGGIVIAMGPLFIKLVLFINNNLVRLLVSVVQDNSLDKFLGNDMLTSITTGNAISTALIISMFIYLFVKLNIKFIIRKFTLIIFTIFTPFAAGLWIINKNVTAATIWIGQIIMNAFMQFIYCFLFIIYLEFVPGTEWAVSLIWAMMIVPIADVLQNCFQNLTSRIAGLDSEQMTGRVLGAGTMFGYGLSTIKEQFKTPKTSVETSNNSSNSGLKGFINRTKSIVSPELNLSPDRDYYGNVNPIRNVIKPNSNIITESISSSSSESRQSKNIIKNVAKTTLSATKTYLEVGASLAEGDFTKYTYKNNKNNNNINLQNVEYMNKLVNNNKTKNTGDENEQKKE